MGTKKEIFREGDRIVIFATFVQQLAPGDVARVRLDGDESHETILARRTAFQMHMPLFKPGDSVDSLVIVKATDGGPDWGVGSRWTVRGAHGESVWCELVSTPGQFHIFNAADVERVLPGDMEASSQ